MIAEELFFSTPVPSPHDVAARFVLGRVSGVEEHRNENRR